MKPDPRRHTGPLDAYRPLDKAYRAVRRLGRWPVGIVYEGAVDGEDTRVCILFPDVPVSQVARFLRTIDKEVQRGKQFYGLPIGGAFLAGESNDHQPFVVLPDASGPNLEQRVERSGPLEPLAALQTAVVIADALTRYHRRGGALGELRPWTVLLPRSRKEQLQLIDLGIGRGVFDQLRQPPTLSPWFAAPSVRAGQEATAAADIHALGALLYYMIVGHAPAADRRPLPSQAQALGGFGDLIDGLVLRAVETTPPNNLPALTSMADFSQALRGIRDLLRLSPAAQRAILGHHDDRPERPSRLGFLDTAGPAVLTGAQLTSIGALKDKG